MSLAIVAGYGDLPTIMLKEMNNIDYIVIDLVQNRDPNRFGDCCRCYKLEYINNKKYY